MVTQECEVGHCLAMSRYSQYAFSEVFEVQGISSEPHQAQCATAGPCHCRIVVKRVELNTVYKGGIKCHWQGRALIFDGTSHIYDTP
mmetsp:Transcript_79/g.76  ORF Transcript_79/g.76 Transcript_79/m.76 type:complete len:87 (+) Transcript_79:164-424(+)